ncbi:MAG: fatty acid desaturase [Planctomycetota bacterium]|jgi:omega-6 fatty acid desaturase (delta-12 desaturase)
MMQETVSRVEARDQIAAWKAIVEKYHEPSRWRASWQLINTIGSVALLWWLMNWSLNVSWWLTLALAALTGLFLVRTFIIFHDCGHGSFFASRAANDFWGFVTGLLTFTPYYEWRGEHAIHHGAAGDLDRRGVGDVWVMTVQEYLESSRWKRFAYRLARNPLFLFGVAPLVLFVVLQRFPRGAASRSQRRSVWWMNGAILAMAVGMSAVFGILPYLVIQLTALLVAGAVGVWLFYLQHQFEDAYWERGPDWNYSEAALRGSSFLKLPKVLQWFSGNIGFHHVHHLSPRIPNYNLERCHLSDPMLEQVQPMTFWAGLKALGLKLWDESSKKLVSFRQMRKTRKEQARRERDGQDARHKHS